MVGRSDNVWLVGVTMCGWSEWQCVVAEEGEMSGC